MGARQGRRRRAARAPRRASTPSSTRRPRRCAALAVLLNAVMPQAAEALWDALGAEAALGAARRPARRRTPAAGASCRPGADGHQGRAAVPAPRGARAGVTSSTRARERRRTSPRPPAPEPLRGAGRRQPLPPRHALDGASRADRRRRARRGGGGRRDADRAGRLRPRGRALGGRGRARARRRRGRRRAAPERGAAARGARPGALDDAFAEIDELAADPARARGRRDRARLLPHRRRTGCGVQEESFRAHIDAREAARQAAGDPRPRRARRRAARPARARARPTSWCSTASPATRRWRATCADRGWYLSFAGTVTFKNAAAAARGARRSRRSSGPGRDRRAVPHADAATAAGRTRPT